MLSSEVAQSLKSFGHFSDLGVGVAMLDFSGKANTSIHGLGEEDTARSMSGSDLDSMNNIPYTSIDDYSRC